MPRDIAGWRDEIYNAPEASPSDEACRPARVTAQACYLCGAWSDDPARCRSPDSAGCAQKSGKSRRRFQVVQAI